MSHASAVILPALLAVALTPGFTTQDGPAHVHSARILNLALQGRMLMVAQLQPRPYASSESGREIDA